MSEQSPEEAARPRRRPRLRARSLVLGVLGWAVVAVPAAVVTFLNTSAPMVIASHDAVVRPTLDGYATVDMGPYVPDLRVDAGSPVGAAIEVGPTSAASYQELIERYGLIYSQPEAQVVKLRDAITGLAVDSVLSGALLGLAGPGLWLLLGQRRRNELLHHLNQRRVAYAGLALATGVVALTQPWTWGEEDYTQPERAWQPLGQALPDVEVPEPARGIEIEAGLLTSGTRRLAESVLDTMRRSVEFYEEAERNVRSTALPLRTPEEGETVAILVSDRHDNVGMDPVARAIADQGGATVLLDAGDDTSTGSEWEAFSLDSLAEAFADFDERYAVAGNHDNGDFVTEYLAELGFTTPRGEVVDGPGGGLLFGAGDPRSSGLGTWRDETEMSFSEHEEKVADLVCEYDADGERVNTVLVHDANTGREALRRGCVDLVVGGHVHAQLGPTLVTGTNGKHGYTYTNGTTGGAAYALAVGSKLRRDAQVTLVTYREGRAIGLQPVTVRTVGDVVVGDFLALDATNVVQANARTVPRQKPRDRLEGGGGGGI